MSQGWPVECSVVVCTRNRAASLEACLGSLLLDQSEPSREILVVDNGSADATLEVIATARLQANTAVRLISEPLPGHCRARNAGVRAANGRVILFTDDDVTVEPGWTRALVAAASGPGVVGVAGRILPIWIDPPPAWLTGPHSEIVTLRDWGASGFVMADDQPPVGANMAVLSAAIEPYLPNPFDLALGHNGSASLGNDEIELFDRLRKHGAVTYEPRAVVHHHVSAARMDWSRFRRAWFQSGFGAARRDARRHATPGRRQVARTAARLGFYLAKARFKRHLTPERAGRLSYQYYEFGQALEILSHPMRRLNELLLDHPI